MEIKTLSSISSSMPFNDMLETFFDEHKVGEDIECYQLVFCPYGRGTSFDDLKKINFQSRVVILNIIDSIIDVNDNTAIDDLVKFCNDYPEQNFIVYHPHLNLQRELDLKGIKVSNLYLDTVAPTNLTETYNRCEKKEISNRWLSFNCDKKFHRVMTISYLLSKDYSKNGDFTFDMRYSLLVPPSKYKNVTAIPSRLKSDFARGFEKLKANDFNILDIPPFNQDEIKVVRNYNMELLSAYEKVGVEIITGTMFFEQTPVLSEKEMQSVYAKNFPIYINGVGMAREMKKFFGIDLFEDIVDHSYDEIEDHFERLAAAIDRNQHLLDGSTNIEELWFDNQQRFEDNCDKMDSMIYDKTYQKIFNHERIKQSLKHFEVSFES
jgi:hypothetical protein